MVRIDLNKALSVATVLRRLEADSQFSVEARFRRIGVSKRQWQQYKSTGVLKVRPETVARFELIARFWPDGSDLSLLPVLLKVLEARKGVKK